MKENLKKSTGEKLKLIKLMRFSNKTGGCKFSKKSRKINKKLDLRINHNVNIFNIRNLQGKWNIEISNHT